MPQLVTRRAATIDYQPSITDHTNIMLDTYLKKILQAPVYDVAVETPSQRAGKLSAKLNNTVLLKREDLQPVFSFKLRGAYTCIANLSEDQRRRGVVTASAGNHAQGVALAAHKLGIKASIVMPRTTPSIKVDSVRSFGVKVILTGDTYDEAFVHAQSLSEQHGLTYVHAYDDSDVIAGQGTIGMEILQQVRGPLDVVFVPVGGGGLLAGVTAYIKAVRPKVKIVGVEPEDAACLKLALEKGRRAKLAQVGIFADGVAVAQIGKEPFRVVKNYVDEVVTASSDEMCAAIKDIFEETRSIAEPAGALALAGLKKYVQLHGCVGKTLIAINSGANTNFDRLRYISERTDVGENAEAVLAVTIPEKPGSFRAFCKSIGKRNITEFNYRYDPTGSAHIFVGVKLASANQKSDGTEDKKQLLAQLRDKHYPVLDLSDDEMAKSHLRHMVGGKAPAVSDEVLYRVNFPERPGALLKFLNGLDSRWNISLFHYRNHGAAYGRILIGLQIPLAERKDFAQIVAKSTFNYVEETENPAYRLFLS